ncbi:MAG: chemotaxis protein CheX [Bacillota bacterium]|jgi:chemotaxis protein CheX
MDEKYILSFIKAMNVVFAGFGLGKVSGENIYSEITFVCNHNLITMIGLTGSIKGIMALSMPYDTAKKIAAAMLMGMEVTELDEISVGALGDLANMICGQAVIQLATENPVATITPPTIIHGDYMKAMISRVETTGVELYSSLGSMELKLGLEM